MKRVFILAGLLTVIASPAVLADYTLYGKANVGIVSNDPDGGDSSVNLHSFASRLGIKGNTELSEGLHAIYKWETEVDLTGGNTGKTEVEDSTGETVSQKTSLLKARNQFVGLKGGFGTIIGGIHDTPMKQAEGKIDLFSDVVDIARVLDPYMDTQEREKDFVGYYSPKFSNMQFQLATMPGKGSNIGDAYSTALVYGDKALKKSNYFAAVAYDSGVDETEDSDAVRLSGAAKFGALKLGAIIEQADTGRASADSQARYVVSGAYKVSGSNSLLLQYVNSEDADNGKKDIAGSSDLTLGLSHQLGKSTTVYGTINKADNFKGEKGADETNLILSVVHKFSFK